MRSDQGDERAVARALDELAERRRGEVWDRLLVQLNELADREVLRRQRAARFAREEDERERDWETRAA